MKEKKIKKEEVSGKTKPIMIPIRIDWNGFIEKAMEKFGYSNVMQIPSIKKVTINTGLGLKAGEDIAKHIFDALTMIAGQKPIQTKSKKSISGFKIRENMLLGYKVTLRSSSMMNFLNKMICVTAPMIRDFRGFESKFDGRGNYSFGIKDCSSVFPELVYGKISVKFGVDICITSSARTDEECRYILEYMGFPFSDLTYGEKS